MTSLSTDAKIASLEAFLQSRAFCPTGVGGGIDNSCGSSGQNSAKAVPKEAASVATLAKGGASRTELQASIEKAIIGKSSWFGGYKPGPVLPSEMCRALGIAIENEDSLDEMMASSWHFERSGIAAAIAQIAAVRSLDPSMLRGVTVRIDTAKTVSVETGEKWTEFIDVAGSYFPATDTVYVLAGTVDSDPKDVARQFESGFISTPSDIHIIVHELAHKGHYREIERKTGLRSPRGGSEKLQESYLRDAQQAAYSSLTSETLADPEWKARFIGKARGVSFYATTDPFELVAEYTAAVRLGQKQNDEDLDRFCRAMLAPVPRRARR
jgi:hypothetical protein